MTITELANLGRRVFIDDVREVTFAPHTAASPMNIVISLTPSASEGVLLDNIYFAGSDGLVHLDIRDVVRRVTYCNIPKDEDGSYAGNTNADVTLHIFAGDGGPYVVTVSGYSIDAAGRMSDIDVLRVPPGFEIPVTLNRWARDWGCERASVAVKFHDHIKTSVLHGMSITGGEGQLVSFTMNVQDLPVSVGNPFFLSFTSSAAGHSPETAVTPRYVVENRAFEQYAFLNRYGNHDFVPMDGALGYAPEFSIEHGRHSSGAETVRASMEEVFVQNSGYLSRQAFRALAGLLTSRAIYHLEADGTWRRIIIENPSVATTSRDQLHSLSFSWRYADNQ